MCLASLMVLIVLLASGPAAQADGDLVFRRLEGPDRYATAAAVALDTFNTRGRVVVASGTSFPDGLAATALAGYFNAAPLLLTAPSHLPRVTRDAIVQIDPFEIALVGGTTAISEAVAAEIRSMGYDVFRVAGEDRYETSVAVAEAMLDSGSHGPPPNAVIVSGESFPDAVAAGPIVYNPHGSWTSLLLVRKDSVPSVVEEHLRRVVTDVVIVGGTAAVSSATADQIKEMCRERTGFLQPDSPCVQRVAGTTRQHTAVAVARYAWETYELEAEHVIVSNGTSFPDALVAGRRANKLGAASLFTVSAETLGEPTRAFLEEHQPTLSRLDVIGDRTAINDDVAFLARRTARGF